MLTRGDPVNRPH